MNGRGRQNQYGKSGKGNNARKVTGNKTGWKESYRKFILLKSATWPSQGPTYRWQSKGSNCDRVVLLQLN